MKEKIKRLQRWSEGQMAPPLELELSLTNRCNQNCLSCWRYGQDIDYDKEAPDEAFVKLIEESADLGVRELHLVGGGELLVRDITPEIMAKAKSYGMTGDLVTNGTLMGQYAEKIVRMGWDRLKVSIDGPNPKIHDYLRGREGAFQESTSNIKKIQSLKEDLGLDKPKMMFNTVVSKENYQQFPEIYQLANELGIEEVLILPLTIFTEKGKELKLGEEERKRFQEIIPKVLNYARREEIDTNLDEFLEEKYLKDTEEMDEVQKEEAKEEDNEKKGGEELLKSLEKNNFLTLPCYNPWFHVTVNANGELGTCFNTVTSDKKHNIQNRSLKESWREGYFPKMRQKLLERNMPEACAKCCVWKVFENRDIREKLRQGQRSKPRNLLARVKQKIYEL